MTPHPPTTGDCVATLEAGCYAAAAGAGGPTRSDGGGEQDAGMDLDAAGCGMASQYIQTGNLECQPCIVTNCCMVDHTCSMDSDCISLFQCTTGCAGLSSCINFCVMSSPAATEYDDFAMCVRSACPSCPLVPVSSFDF
jgi:hypothetical protein